MKKIFKILKSFVIAGFTIFTFNMLVIPLNIYIPINFFTIIFTMAFGIMSLPFFSILIMFFI